MLHPHALLTADRPVGAAADDVAQRERFPHARDRDDPGRIADFERTVDVETDELGHVDYFFNARPTSVRN